LAISSIAELERDLLSDSEPDDMNLPSDITQDKDFVLTAKQVKRDISVFARAVINAYGGWPFLDKVIKRKILNALLRLRNGTDCFTAGDLFETLGAVVALFPDNHISLRFENRFKKTALGHAAKNVGTNVASVDDVAKVFQHDGILVVAIRRLLGTWNGWDALGKTFLDMVHDSRALIIDLRDNGGGHSRPTDKLADYLYGAPTRAARRVYVRATPEAAIIHVRKNCPEWQHAAANSADPAILEDFTDTEYPKFGARTPGYNKPIYILINNGTMSSAEMFCTRMRHHPFVQFVGANSRGGEVYGDVSNIILPGSKIRFTFGCVYRQLEQPDFELHGYAPDIECRDGQDAYETALADLSQRCKIPMQNNGISK